MRIVYLGTPEIAVPPLDALVEAGFDVGLVITAPERRRGRGSATSPTPVGERAAQLGIPVIHDVAELADGTTAFGFDVGVVVAFGEIIRKPVLDALPMVNLHFSLLPRWRGAAPVERAILEGDAETGVCVMAVERGLDTGGVFARAVIPIGARATADELRTQLTAIGSRLLVKTLGTAADRPEGLGEPEPQVGDVTYAHKLGPEDFHLDWTSSAASLDRIIRVGPGWCDFRGARFRVHAAQPFEGPASNVEGGTEDVSGTVEPGEFVQLPGRRIAARCGDGLLELMVVQAAGKAAQPAAAWASGARLGPEDRLS